MIVRLIVCGLCISEGVPPEQRFRASDSERGRRAVSEHILEDHSASAVNELLFKGVDLNVGSDTPDLGAEGR